MRWTRFASSLYILAVILLSVILVTNAFSVPVGQFKDDKPKPSCFGHVANDTLVPHVCSGKGYCVKNDTCACIDGFGGLACEFQVCSESLEVICHVRGGMCGANGAASCTCNDEYVGGECQNRLCQNNITLIDHCSGHGLCNDNSQCDCDSDFFGDFCQYSTCGGIGGDNGTVCNGVGFCQVPDRCVCKPGYEGKFCEIVMPEPSGDFGDHSGFPQQSGFPPQQSGNFPQQSGFPPQQSGEFPPQHSGNFPQHSGFPQQSGQPGGPFSCYGVSESEFDVCSGHGTCVSHDVCACDKGYFSHNCAGFEQQQTHSCFGISNVDSDVCSSRGKCVAENQCQCFDPVITGEQCQFYHCPNNTKTGVCNGHGQCQFMQDGNSLCACDNGYDGAGCDYKSARYCYGKSDTDPSVCGGKGICVEENICQCSDPEFGGQQCDEVLCYGKPAGDYLVCSGAGSCIGPNNCSCFSDFTFGAQCNETNCGNVSDCNIDAGHGVCVGINTCYCRPGYTGDDCSGFNCNDRANCSGHGVCVDANHCECQKGYEPDSCSEITCFGRRKSQTDVCNFNGKCVDVDKCECRPGFSGEQCKDVSCFGKGQKDPESCSGRGYCVGPDTCKCMDALGPNCNITACYGVPASNHSSVCSGHGDCVNPNQCECDAGWTGQNCQFPVCFGKKADEKMVCSGRGKCIAPDTCACKQNVTGAECDVVTCFGISSKNSTVCNSVGECVGLNTCKCPSTWFGEECKVPTCNYLHPNHAKVCNGRGKCVGFDKCDCKQGFGGVFCKEVSCFGVPQFDPKVCGGRGKCVGLDVCHCTPGFNGTKCEIQDEFSNFCYGYSENDEGKVCNGNGFCVGKDDCQCDSGYTGKQCEYAICHKKLANDTKVCSGNGYCAMPNTCVCFSGYDGPECNNFNCHGISAKNATVCGGNGKCVAPNVCQCKDGYLGDCSVTNCFGFESNHPYVCSGNGECVAPQKCSCESGYNGIYCQRYECFNVTSTSKAACSGHGECAGRDQCKCAAGYVGSKCETPVCFGLNANDAKVCNGNGKCVAPNQCTCLSTTNKGFAGPQCNECRPDLRVYPACNETFCNSQSTCNGKGSCNAKFECDCFNNSTLGFYQGPFCRKCQDGFFGPNCNKECNAQKTCSGHGKCSQNGECECFMNEEGAWAGPNCNKCAQYVFGKGCKTGTVQSLKFANGGDFIFGNWPAPRVPMQCSDIIHHEDVVLLGKKPRCGFFNDHNWSEFAIYFGSGPQLEPGQQLRFNLEFTNSTTKPFWFPVTVNAPQNVENNVFAKIRAPQDIGSCDGVKLDGTQSKSRDGRALQYVWTAVGANDASLDQFLADEKGPMVIIPAFRLNLGKTYQFKLTVKNFMQQTAHDIVQVKKDNNPRIRAAISGPVEQTTSVGKFFRLDAFPEYTDCFLEPLEFEYIWIQTAGPPTPLARKVKSAILFDKGSLIPAEYEFMIYIRSVANALISATAPVKLTVTAKPVSVRAKGGLVKVVVANEPFTLELDAIDPDSTNEPQQFYWQCSNSEDNSECPSPLSTVDSASNSTIKFSKGAPAGEYKIDFMFTKGSRMNYGSQLLKITQDATVPRVSFAVQPPAIVPAYQGSVDFAVIVDGNFVESRWTVNDEIVPTEKATRLKLDIIPGNKYVVAFAAKNAKGEMGGVGTELTVNVPPQPGSIQVTPKKGNSLNTFFTFIANQFSTKTEGDLQYIWTISTPTGKVVSSTSATTNNVFQVEGLPAGPEEYNYELDVAVTVVDSLNDKYTIHETVIVEPFKFENETVKDEMLLDKTNDVADKTAFHQQNELSMNVDTITSNLNTKKRAVLAVDIKQQILNGLLAAVDTSYRSIDPATPLDSSYFARISNNVNSVVQSGSLGSSGMNLTLGLVSQLLKDSASQSIELDTSASQSLVESVSTIVAKDPTLAKEASKILVQVAQVMSSSNSQGNSIGVPKEIKQTGTTIYSVRYALSDILSSAVNISSVQGASISSGAKVSFTQGVYDLVADLGLTTIDVSANLYDDTFNTDAYVNTQNSLWASLFLELELRDPANGDPIDVSNVGANGITLTLPASFDLSKPIRNPLNAQSSGWYPTCRYLNEISNTWVADNTCTVKSYTASEVVCACSHLTVFGATFDYKAASSPPPSPSPGPNTPPPAAQSSEEEEEKPEKAKSKVGVIVGVILGVGGAVVIVALLIAVIVVFFVFRSRSKKHGRVSENRGAIELRNH